MTTFLEILEKSLYLFLALFAHIRKKMNLPENRAVTFPHFFSNPWQKIEKTKLSKLHLFS